MLRNWLNQAVEEDVHRSCGTRPSLIISSHRTKVTLKPSPTEPVKPEEFDISGHYKPEEEGRKGVTGCRNWMELTGDVMYSCDV